MAVDVSMIFNSSDVVAEDAVEFVSNGKDHMSLNGLVMHETDSTEAIATASFSSDKQRFSGSCHWRRGVDCSPCHLVVRKVLNVTLSYLSLPGCLYCYQQVRISRVLASFLTLGVNKSVCICYVMLWPALTW